MKVSWGFYSRRKNIDLKSFLVDHLTLESALSYFNSLGIVPPEDLCDFYLEREDPSLEVNDQSHQPSEEKSPPAAPKKTRPRRSSKSNNKTSSTTARDKKKDSYFRKVIKKEK